jgi:dihydrofolate reductase
MAKLIATINMTLDGFCDHTVMIADEELHQHFTEVLKNAGAILYGRTTYQLMENFWPTIIKNPTGDKSMDDFAVAIENIPKIVFSRTLNDAGWKNARLAKGGVKEEVLELKQQSTRDIFVGSPSLIVATMRLNLVDEYQLCVHPVIAGNGLSLFKNITDSVTLKLLNTKTLKAGQMMLYYQPIKK